jgi:mannose-6-phosphate isomerase-like protein (cupin superfamily)
MAVQPGPHDLENTRVIIGPAGAATLKQVTANVYQELDEEFDDFAGHLLVQPHTFDSPWPTWEVHPHGDEFVYLLAGDTDFILRTETGDETVRVDQPGSFVMVPRGTCTRRGPMPPPRCCS